MLSIKTILTSLAFSGAILSGCHKKSGASTEKKSDDDPDKVNTSVMVSGKAQMKCNGNPLAGARIILNEKGAGIIYETKTDNNGHYSLNYNGRHYPYTTFIISCSLPGYTDLYFYSSDEVTHQVKPDTAIVLDFAMGKQRNKLKVKVILTNPNPGGPNFTVFNVCRDPMEVKNGIHGCNSYWQDSMEMTFDDITGLPFCPVSYTVTKGTMVKAFRDTVLVQCGADTYLEINR